MGGAHGWVVGWSLDPDGQVIEGESAVRVSPFPGAGTRADGSTGPWPRVFRDDDEVDSWSPRPIEGEDRAGGRLGADEHVDDPAVQGAEDAQGLVLSGRDPGHGGDGAQVVEGDGEDALGHDAAHLLAGEVVEPGADVADGAGGVELGPLGGAEGEGVEHRSG